MDEDLTSSDGDSKTSESECKSLANNLPVVTQKRASTSTKLLKTSYKRVKKPMQNGLAASQLEMMNVMTQVMGQRLEKKTTTTMVIIF